MIGTIEYYNQLITDWFRAYYADGVFLLLAILAFVYLFVNCKELRYKILLPIFGILFLLVNPILYMYVFSRVIYWRLLWMLPSALLISAAVIALLKQLKKNWMKWGILAIATAFIISQGQYMFAYGVFFPRSNWEKLAQETIDVCDIMLEYDETPKALVHSPINTEVRQYAPEVELFYGREATGYIRERTVEAAMLSFMMDCQSYADMLSMIKNMGGEFVVVQNFTEISEDILETYGFVEVRRTAGHIVYCSEELAHVSENNE